MDTAERQAHWDDRYRTAGADQVSWYAPAATVSLELVDALGVGPDTAVIDIGGGASHLVDHLVARGFGDVTVLDVSAEALDVAAARVGAGTATWVRTDLLTWVPERRYGLWHDRAVLHFLTEPTDRARYRSILEASVVPGGAVIVATFAPDGPETCSGLPVVRYDPAGLAAVLGERFEVTADRREDHVTPAGGIQPFTWIAARRTG